MKHNSENKNDGIKTKKSCDDTATRQASEKEFSDSNPNNRAIGSRGQLKRKLAI